MRLVNIDDCDKELFFKQIGGKDSLITVETAFEMLEALPVVYDVGKVIEELENSKKSIIGRYDSSVPMSEMPSRKIEYNKGIDKAIEIVKAGGMDE